MTKFKHNDRVTCIIDGTTITDARISINKYGTPFICQNEEEGTNANDKLGYKYSWVIDKDFTGLNVSNLRLVEEIPAEEMTAHLLHEAIITCEQAGYTVKMTNSTTSTQHTTECIKRVEYCTEQVEEYTDLVKYYLERAEHFTKKTKECTCEVIK